MPAIILEHVKHKALLEALGLEFDPEAGATIIYGEANVGANVGDGTGLVYRDKIGVTLNFRTLKADPSNPGITITTDGDIIKLGTVAGTGNVVGTPPSVADGVATYDGETGLLIDGPDIKAQTLMAPVGEDPTLRANQLIRMRTADGGDWADILGYGEYPDSPGNRNQITIGDATKYPASDPKESGLLFIATLDPIVSLVGYGTGRVIHEAIQAAWEIRREGKISQEVGANTAILTLKNGASATYTEVRIKAGNVLPNGVIDGKNGDRYYFRDSSDASNTAEYMFRDLTPGNNSWEVAGGGGVTDHGALTGLGDDDHTQYALLAGRAGGQRLVGGLSAINSLILQATAGVGASGSSVDIRVGDDGDILALRAMYNGKVGVGTNNPLGNLAVKAASTKTIAIAVQNSSDVLIFDVMPDASNGGVVRLRNASNALKVVISATGNSRFAGGDVAIGTDVPAEKLHVVGSIRMVDGEQILGKRLTDKDGNGTAEWQAGVAPTQSRTSTIVLNDNHERVTITDGPVTVTVPAAPVHGKSYRVMNANGVTNGEGNASNVTLDIFGSTVKFNGGGSVGNTLALPNDGDWVYIWFDEDFGDDGTWWVNSNISLNTGNNT